MLVRPSVMFLGLFWLQVQFASAVNAVAIFAQLPTPWPYLLIIHVFPLAILAWVLLTFRTVPGAVAEQIEAGVREARMEDIGTSILLLLVAIYSVVAIYLWYVPFERTGLYALLFRPGELDEYREASMKLLDSRVVVYSFAIMEKVLAPLAGGFAAVMAVKAFRERRFSWALPAAAAVGLAGLPTLLYGARGPLSMVMLAAIVTGLLVLVRQLRVAYFAGALVLVLLPISLVMTLKSSTFDLRTAAYHAVNILDRAIGRNYIDNVWHVAYVEKHGFHGMGGIEKLAPIFGVEPVDILNVVGREYAGQGASTGLAFLEFKSAPEARVPGAQPSVEEELPPPPAVDISQTVSSGAAFQTLNYAMFGLWSLPFSLTFVFAMDLLLFAALKMPKTAVAPVFGALSVPILGLCFSLMTTALASKGLLLIPIVGALVGSISHLPNRTSPAPGCR